MKPGSRNRGKGIEVFDSMRDIERHLAAQRRAPCHKRPVQGAAACGLALGQHAHASKEHIYVTLPPSCGL
jgi:hypothetical protein